MAATPTAVFAFDDELDDYCGTVGGGTATTRNYLNGIYVPIRLDTGDTEACLNIHGIYTVMMVPIRILTQEVRVSECPAFGRQLTRLLSTSFTVEYRLH